MKKEAEIPSLTGIRALAAYMVFIHHYFGSNCDGKFWCPVALEMQSGVALFFVLSGFLITYKYYQPSALNLNWLKDYYISRFARIYPLFFLVTALSLVFLKSPLQHWLLSLTFLKGFFNDYKFIVISQTWTLSVELVFYFLAPVIFLLSKKGGSVILQFLAIFLIGILVMSGGKIQNLDSFLSGHLFWFIYTFFGRSFEFFVGILLALIIKRQYPTSEVGYHMGNKFTLVGLIGIILVIISISTFQSGMFRYGIFSPQGLLIHNFILPIMIAIFFLGLIIEKTLVSSFLSSKLMQLLGKSSYAFYLIHLGVLAQALPSLKFNMLSFFISLNIYAILLYYFIEKPANVKIKKMFSGHFPN